MDFFLTGKEFPTLVDFDRKQESGEEVEGEKRKVKLEKGMLSLLDLLRHERSEKRRRVKADGRKLIISFWEPADERVKLLREVVEKGEEGLKAIDRLRAKLLKESIRKGKWY